MKLVRLIPASLALAAALALCADAAAYDPAYRWRTIQTEHFNIHYHQGESFLAYKGARVFEEVYAILTAELQHELHQKRMDVVIVDSTDDSNGFASSRPYPMVTLYATAPMSRASLEGYDDWLWAIFVHEYTHILHIDTVEGINKVWRFLFGNTIKVNHVVPGWQIEGITVFDESRFTGGGRNRSAWADMLVRMSVLEHQFPAIDQGDGYIDAWPGGYVRYIWGGRFHQWAAEAYGEHIWTAYSHRHAAQVIPYVQPAAKVFGKRFVHLWKDWQADLERDYRDLQRRLMEQGLTDVEVLTEQWDFAESPIVSPDGAWIYHDYRHYRGPSAIRRMRVDGGEPRELTRHWSTQGMTLSPDGKTLYFSAMRPYRIDYAFADLYRFDLEGRRPWRRERLTRGARAYDPDMHPDGQRLVCVVNGLAQNDLAIWTEDGGLRRITATQDHTQYDTPRWSPDGRTIAVSVWRPGGYRDILLMDEEGRVVRELTRDRAIDIEPTWSPDGRFVLFSSDRTGIYNIFACSLEDGRLYQVTNVLAGAFHPAVTPDGRWLVFEGYRATNRDIRRAIYDPETWTPYDAAPPDPPDTAIPARVEPEVALPSRRYNPMPTLVPPRYWVPIVEKHDDWSDWSLGGETGGRDAVRLHAWGLALSYRTAHRYLGWSAYYQLDAFRPSIRVGYVTYSLSQGRMYVEHVPDPEGDVGAGLDGFTLGDDVYLERRDRAYLHVSLPLHARHRVWAGYTFDWHSPLRDTVVDDAYAPLLPGVGSYPELSVGYGFSQTRSYRYSVSPESGFQASINADLTYPWLGARAHDWTGEAIVQKRTVITGEARAYLSMPWWRNHVLAVRVAGGGTLGSPVSSGTFSVGGSFSQGSNLGAPSHGFPLRGYRTGAMRGDRVAVLNAEYRFPLFFVERGFGTLPLYIRGVHALVAIDVGGAWSYGDYASPAEIAAGDATWGQVASAWFDDLRTGMAVELFADIVPGYDGLLRARVGYAAGLGPGGISFGQESFYIGLGSSF